MHPTFLILGLGTGELILIALLILLLFGAKKLPEMMKGLGKGIKSFKEEMSTKDSDGKNSESSSKTSDGNSSENA